jgi:hypothetical protein
MLLEEQAEEDQLPQLLEAEKVHKVETLEEAEEVMVL